MTSSVWINGRPHRWVDAADRGFQYGDGLFETFRIHRGVPLFWQRHMDRLRRGCERLDLPFPSSELLRREADTACMGLPEGVLKFQLTRGSGGRGYTPPQETQPTRVWRLHPLPDGLEELRKRGARVRLCHTRLGINPALAGIKHCNRLEQVLARKEWNDPSVYEGLMCDGEGFLVEGTLSNVFWRRSGVLITPRVDRCGVAGVVRAWVLDRARQWNAAVKEVRARPEVLAEAEEVFLTNSVIGVIPVVAGVDRPVRGSWPVGSFTARLMSDWKRCLVQEEIV
ncbi:aminodeoxychorismate lyase [Methylohalobius crimeensis]|uniref:aminodeoxychorismate lyase n=1 Tax=Methylohalobius crimeensis TaxID=244365 RepID=UPI0003B6017B|nr:aminodeoxychorismate lyase [Methylohalobius crimeensis]